MYGAYGVSSPFLPAFLGSRGLRAEELGLALGAATGLGLVSAPLAGRIGDRLGALRGVLVISIAAAALVTLGYFAAGAFWALLPLVLLHEAALAPMTVLADALALGAAARPGSFEYGRVRGTGSAAFILGTLVSGQAIGAFGLDVIIGLQALLLGAAAFAAMQVPEIEHPHRWRRKATVGVGALLRIARYRHLVVLAALVVGSHAMHDAFAVILWSAAGISPVASSLLWSEAVAAEVLVFWLIGPALVTWLTPAGAMAVAGAAGALRWTVMATSSDVAALALVQPLHGLTFALLHLACMRVLVRTVPQGLEGTAQALYATVGVGAATALLTLASGALYGRLGQQAFWFMAALCAAALPLTLKLRGA
jgi:PPP family 3-phenylpropionic acid transporter